MLNEMLVHAGFELMDEGFRIQWNPDDVQQQNAVEYGKKLGEIK